MGRVSKLPPPPEKPVRSPPANVVGEEEIMVARGDGGPRISARVRVPASPVRAVVLAHPHPLYGGSMHSPVVLSIARVLAEKEKIATLRFDFRGVGASEGKYDDGRGEIDDVMAAIAELRRRAPGVPVSIAGHSFGSWVGLRAAAADSPELGSGGGAPGETGKVDRVALVAPSIRFFQFTKHDGVAFAGRIKVFIGDDDEFSDVDEARQLASLIGAEIEVFPGFDHHFMKSRRRIAEAVVPFVAPEIA
jgi:alpha/beta superfamily hydrolase